MFFYNMYSVEKTPKPYKRVLRIVLYLLELKENLQQQIFDAFVREYQRVDSLMNDICE